MRQASVFWGDRKAGILSENEEGYSFTYLQSYVKRPDAVAISLSLPLQGESFTSKTMFSFFDGLIPEGWLLDIAVDTWKIDLRDRMGLLLTCCKDCIGAVSVVPLEATEDE